MDDIVAILETSFREISELIRNQNSLHLGNQLNELNISGDDVKHVDVVSNNILKYNLEKCDSVRAIGSEEEDELYTTQHTGAPYLVCYDPLDGSSNVDVNITTGTIFAVYKYENDGTINSGRNIVMSGYCLYGGCTQYLLARDNVLSMYQYVPNDKNFVCIRDNMKIRENGGIYSLNDANRNVWTDARYATTIDAFREKGYNSRWVGSLVADGHRTLIKGGFFAHPANKKNAHGKIRLLYEAYPFAHIFETAGGIATDGNVPLLDVPYPDKLHQKTPIVLASKTDYATFEALKK